MYTQCAELPKIEIWSYFLIWIGGVFYSIYHVHLASSLFGRQLVTEDLAPGWTWVGRPKDVADYEWRMWLPFLLELAPWLVIHHVGAELLRCLCNQVFLQVWYVLLTVLFVVHYAGALAVFVLVGQPCLLLFAMHIGGCKAVWLASLPVIISLNFYQSEEWTEEQQFTISVCIAWLHLRAISFCMDEASVDHSRSDGRKSPQTLRMLSYTLYLPLMFLGPLVLYHHFAAGLNQEGLSSGKCLWYRLKLLVRNLLRFIGWLIFTEWALHYVYCNAIQLQYEALPFFDAWTLNGLAYCIGQFFLNKYVVIYGLMGTLAQVDGILAPPIPQCISHISLYSDMWRHFDRGFYNFLVRYVYFPLCGNGCEKKRSTLQNSGTLHRLWCSALCFAFVYVWHGLSQCILVWSVCNFLGITVETAARNVSSRSIYKQWESKLSVQNVRRWRALISSPLFIMSALTMFYFFGGMEVGNVFVLQVIQGSVKSNSVLLFFSYCMCQVSVEIKRRKWTMREVQ